MTSLHCQGLCFGCGEGGQHCAIMGYRAIEHLPAIRKYGRVNKKFYLNTGSAKGQFCGMGKMSAETQRARRKQVSYCLLLQFATTSWSCSWPSPRRPRGGCRASWVRTFTVGGRRPRGLTSRKGKRGKRGDEIEGCWPTFRLWFSSSMRLTHGTRVGFLVSMRDNLGEIKAVALRWKYDHEIDPLNLTKVRRLQ